MYDVSASMSGNLKRRTRIVRFENLNGVLGEASENIM